MEVLAAIIGSALTEPFKVVFGSIYAAMKNRFKIHSNYNHLERDITLVLALKTRLRSGLDDEQLQHLLPTTQVQEWISKVEELENNFNSLHSECDLLPNLEELVFYGLTESDVESISDCSNFFGLRFTKLRSIAVHNCYQLENLFTMDGTLHELANLESIVIRNCENLSQVFKNTSTNNFVPMLEYLYLDGLPALEEICKADESWKSLKELRVRKCSMLLKLPLSVQSAENIQSITGEQNWWNELQWDNENLKMHLQPHFKPRG